MNWKGIPDDSFSQSQLICIRGVIVVVCYSVVFKGKIITCIVAFQQELIQNIHGQFVRSFLTVVVCKCLFNGKFSWVISLIQ